MKFWKNLIKTHFIAAVLLAAAGLLAVGSMWKDSAIRDEMPHIVAGYSYLTEADYRVNPEHPPLIKELAALPLLFQNIYFPQNDPAWRDNVNDQWDLGDKFLYKYGNDADQMLFAGRIMMVLVFLLGGWVLYRFSEKIIRRRELALVALALFLFSPNLMAHGRFITTDMGATIFTIFALYAYYLYLERPNWGRFIWAGIVFGLAQLAKFNLFLLIPTFLVIAFLHGISTFRKGKIKIALQETGLSVAKAIGIMAIGYLLVGVWYEIHIWNMPIAVQHKLINESITDRDLGKLGFNTLLNNMTDISLLRPYAQYLLGFLMVSAHTTGGHTTYFFGEIGTHWPEYFVFAYFLKETIAAQILFYFAVMVFFTVLAFTILRRKFKLGIWVRENAVMIGYFFFALLVFIMSSMNRLQLGIRYILPVFPFLYLFIALMLWKFSQNFDFKKRLGYYWANIIILVGLLIWHFGSNVSVFPSYLPYFNEFIGGSKNGWKYMVDSNVDWGQDLIRLRDYADKNNIQTIKVDYFGGGNLDYYLGNRYESWGYNKMPSKGWFALSASAIQWNTLNPPQKGNYHWLTDNYQPVDMIGNSILIYHIPEE
ncbi:MAG: glycosyltransferase family 39 protein [Candidatus Moranbacteria bacterium]|nr:glycosyltransferase family 39 protein [Candidatus Moranbacteria bacterium]